MQTTGYTQKKQGQIRLYQRISERDSTDLETNVLERWNQNELEPKKRLLVWSISVKYGGGSVMVMGMYGSQ